MSTQLLTSPQMAHETVPQMPRIVEVVGPAGAGKTSLCTTLAAASSRVRQAIFPDVRSPKATPFFLWHALRTIPCLLEPPPAGSRRLTGREFAWLSILDGWAGILLDDSKRGHQTSLLDQGPVYLFTELRQIGPEHLGNHLCDRVWQALYDKWASSLDVVVWLDAPDAVLVERIRGREKEHLVKEQPDAMIADFIHRFRIAYKCTLSLLSCRNENLRILSFDTSSSTLLEIAHNLSSELGLTA